MDLDKYLAKGNKTIAQHINDLQHCLEVLVNLGYVETEHLKNLIYIACKYHYVLLWGVLCQNQHSQDIYKFDSFHNQTQ